MGIKNYLIEGMSGTGKTTVAKELQRRGYHVIHGDRSLAYRGDPKTGEPLDILHRENAAEQVQWEHEHWIWDVEKVKLLIADQKDPISFFCGGSRNFFHFIDWFDGVFVLDVRDVDVLHRRMDERVARDPTEWGGNPEDKELVARLHVTKADIPKGDCVIDSTAPLDHVVNAILEKCQ